MSMDTRLRELLDPFDKCRVECDGFVRIASFKLFEQNIKHTVYSGYAFVPNAEGNDHDLVRPHFWIELEDEDELAVTVDYRLRMWVGDHAPHGVFYNDGDVDYEYVNELQIPPSKQVFDILTSL